MKNVAAYLVEKERIELGDRPMPVVGPDDVLIEVKHVGICGSDVQFYVDPSFGGRFETKLPVILGHESAGVVVEVGKNVTHLAVGDRVAVEPGVPCGKCEFCLSGRYNLCPEVDFMACPPWHRAAFQKYISHPANFCFKLPDNVSTVEGALVEPLAVGLHAANRSGAHLGQTALITGSGCIGLMTLLSIRSMGVSKVIVSDIFDNRLEYAKKLGADYVINAAKEDTLARVMELTGGQGADVVYETAGNPKTMAQTPDLVKTGGTVAVVGNVHGITEYDFLTINNKEVNIMGIFRYRNIYPMAINAISAGSINVKAVATNFMPFEKVNEAFQIAHYQKQTALKVVVEM